MKNVTINVCLAIGSLLIFVLIIEFGLRITGLQTVAPNPPKIYTRDANPNISYKLKPNLVDEKAYKATVSTDKNGFRLNGSSKLKAQSSKLIAILGDSIAFGYGVHDNETLAAQLEHYPLSTIRYTFRNAAVPGYQLQQQRALYKDYAAKLNPDAVMIVFYWNDLDGGKPGVLDDDGILRPHGWKPSDDRRSLLERHSAFYISYRKLMSLVGSKKSQKEERVKATQEAKDPVNTTYLDTYISDLSQFASTLPKERYFVIWPDNYLHEETKPQLIEAAQSAGFTVIDLYELFGNQVETLGWDTVHPSAKSIEKAASFIANFIHNS